jgi:Flp pilus assembly protein TadG
MVRPPSPRRRTRAGTAAVEMALVLPVLAFLAVISIDFARVFYFSQTVANCARNGALYESDAYVKAESPYKTLEEATFADASNLNDPASPLTVTRASGYDAAGRAYVEVTVHYTFKTITNFPGVPSKVTMHRTVRVAVAPPNPS